MAVIKNQNVALFVGFGIGLMFIWACGGTVFPRSGADNLASLCKSWSVKYFDLSNKNLDEFVVPEGYEPMGGAGGTHLFEVSARKCVAY